MPSLIVLHKIPLTVVLNPDDTIDITCDVPGVTVEDTPGSLNLGLPPPKLKLVKHVYAYTIDPPPATAQYRYFAAVFSGPEPHQLELWKQHDGESQSDTFSVDDGPHSEFIVVTVLAQPQPGGPPAEARVVVGRRRVNSDYQGGGDNL